MLNIEIFWNPLVAERIFRKTNQGTLLLEAVLPIFSLYQITLCFEDGDNVLKRDKKKWCIKMPNKKRNNYSFDCFCFTSKSNVKDSNIASKNKDLFRKWVNLLFCRAGKEINWKRGPKHARSNWHSKWHQRNLSFPRLEPNLITLLR